jgi:hypothetical protein
MHEQIEEAARMLYENIKADIENASTRIEHIRLTSLAQEAANLLTEIENFNGLAAAEAVIDSNGEEI